MIKKITLRRKPLTISNGRIRLRRKPLVLTKTVKIEKVQPKPKIKLRRKKLDTSKLKNNRRRTGIYA